MQTLRSKSKATAIVICLMLTIGTLIAVFPTANAAVVTYHTYCYISISPGDVIGVNQQMLLVFWTAQMPPDIGEIATLGGRATWKDVAINVTYPDGTTHTFVMPTTDSVGGSYVQFTPQTVGTYYAWSVFPEQWRNTTATQSRYLAAVSNKVAFTVQQEPIQAWSEPPLPDGYWTRPINNANRDWSALGGNWLAGAYQQPIGDAGSAGFFGFGGGGGTTTRLVTGKGPESAHILWTKPYWTGGMMDESFGSTGYMTAHYQFDFSGSMLILQGKVYYPARADAHKTQGWLCVDLYTGETLYFDNNTLGTTAMPSFGQIYNYESPNQHGGIPYLWRTSGVTLPPNTTTTASGAGFFGMTISTVWEMLDGYTGTGNSVTKIANVSDSGTAVYGKDGSILRYSIINYGTTANPNYYLQVWNTSAIPTMLATTTGTTAWQWRPSGGGFGGGPPLGVYVHDGNKGYSLNKSISSILGPRNAIFNQTGAMQFVREGQFVIVGDAGLNDERGIVKGFMMAFNLKPDSTGGITPTKLWDMSFTPPAGSQADNVTISLTGVYPDDNVICFQNVNLLKRWGYSLKTGEKLWESAPEPQLNYYTMQTNYYKGMLLTTGFGGVLLAYNITTGQIIWNYTAKNVGFESTYGNYPINIFAICDDKIYTLTGEHSVTQPIWRGPNMRCINAMTGEEIWKLMNFGANGGASLGGLYEYMADGKVVGLNLFDMMIYCVGKGPSATSVSASPKVSVHGNSVLIEGTVTDQSPSGKRNTNDRLDFALKGTPAISDADQEAWMEYMFMQQQIPANAKGVEVTLDAIDPNNNFVHIGTTTSDITGKFAYAYTPEVPGTYQIIATFAGSKAYGSSFDQSYLTVDPAPATPAAPEPATAQPPVDMYILYATIAMIIAVAIATILILRKKP
jgi:hypothetical protein